MKKAMRIIVPLLLILAVLGSLVWYLLVYDRGFTMDVLLSEARRQESLGNHSRAAWFYNLAYAQSGNGEDVAIELAEQFRSIGNYTKAEFTLSGAIADGGSAKLYTALCKLYVEQDKLLDAVNMLDSVADPAIRQELDKLRPAAPVATPDPGFHTQYISVSISAPGGTLYYTTNGEYPSTGSSLYTEPISLGIGETTIYALSVGDNGLVSKLAVFGYTVGGVVEPVVFTDAAIEQTVRQMLGTREGAVIYTNELWDIFDFTVPAEAASLADLSYFPYLRNLTVSSKTISLAPIASVTSLERLDLSGCRPSGDELTAIADLPNLKQLILADCGLSTIAPLANAKGLTYLDLSSNTIRNIQTVSGMTGLQTLLMPHNALTSLSALTGMTSLQTLDVSYNTITTLVPLGNCTGLMVLDVSNNALTALDGMNRMANLQEFNCSYNQITDVSLLAPCANLTVLNISNNAVMDILMLGNLAKLRIFNFSHNFVTELPLFPANSALITIDGSYNQITLLDPLKDLPSINHVLMDYNLLTSVDVLANCYTLVLVNVYGNDIKDVSALTEHSIVVNYDPT